MRARGFGRGSGLGCLRREFFKELSVDHSGFGSGLRLCFLQLPNHNRVERLSALVSQKSVEKLWPAALKLLWGRPREACERSEYGVF